VTGHGKKFDHFVEIVRKLRSEKGCPWDREQTSESLIRYLLEETEEAIEAIKSKNYEHSKDELGDILYILVLLAQIHDEDDIFNIGDVLDAITAKMIRRHPHVFGDAEINSVTELRKKWHEIKNAEKSTDRNIQK
jgi:MazG family protein